MMTRPIPENELGRVIALSDLNIDFSNFENNFNDLAKLAAKIAGTQVSLVNLIDSYTQWIVSNHGHTNGQAPREETVCQYTITENDHFEVKNLLEDDRFREIIQNSGGPQWQYYYGLPLKLGEYNLGALCMLDFEQKTLSPEKIEMLHIIGEEIVNRLKIHKYVESLKNKMTETKSTQAKVVHDIRGPIAGIIGLAELISQQGDDTKMEEVLDFIKLIQKSGKSILELADDILESERAGSNKQQDKGSLTIDLFKEKLEKLYAPQAKSKGIVLEVNTAEINTPLPFASSKLMQITGNLISNAIKFTPKNGSVVVTLKTIDEAQKLFVIKVSDTGTGMTEQQVERLMNDTNTSTTGTAGEKGYGFGLPLVNHLIKGLRGCLHIKSEPDNGTSFTIELPLKG